jgi:biopolymer transport protein ExbD
MLHDESMEEPDVTPLININLLLLVMTLLIASHAARLLPLDLPTAQTSTALDASQAVQLHVEKGGTFQLQADTGLAKDDLAAKLQDLPEDATVLISIDADARYEHFVWAMDRIMDRPAMQVAFGGTQVVTPGVTPGAAPKAGDAAPKADKATEPEGN